MGEKGRTPWFPMGLSVVSYGRFLAGNVVGWAVGGGCISFCRACGGRDDVWYARVSFEVEIRNKIFQGALPVDPLYYSGF